MRTKDRALMIVASAFFGVGLALGCGGDGDGGGGDVSTGIAPSKLLSDVTPSEAAQACERLEAGFADVFSEDVFIRTICTLFGAATADTAAACTTARDMCIQEASQSGSETMEAVGMAEFEFECGDGAAFSECAATTTVGQLEACFNDALDVFSAVFDDVTCDDAASFTMDDLENFGDSLQPPASCESLECGEDSLFGGEE